MADLTLTSLVQRQLRLLAQVCDTLTMRALAGARDDLDNLFLAQQHLEHWLQYLSPLAMDTTGTLDAPAPLPWTRPAPPLPHEEETYMTRAREGMGAQAALDALEQEMRPRVSFPPEPLWVDDLERDPGAEP